jgi:pimeloyl-ACP methyl ester carboxylesterase
MLDVQGVRLHYLDRGAGEALVVLHGNGSMVQDFAASGVLARAADTRRVIVFDRPGYGRSSRPGDRAWTPEEQADLFGEALRTLGVTRAIVLGHSWGTLVALALARRDPALVSGLVLASGYFYPTPRLDAAVLAGPAVPVIGDLARYTVAPLAARLMWPMILRKLFGPAPVPPKFAGFPVEMAVRPSQLRAAAEESGLMVEAARRASRLHGEIAPPVAIVAGQGDRIVDTDRQSRRLHEELPGSLFLCVPGAGHMVHHTEPESIVAAVEAVADMAAGRGTGIVPGEEPSEAVPESGLAAAR